MASDPATTSQDTDDDQLMFRAWAEIESLLTHDAPPAAPAVSGWRRGLTRLRLRVGRWFA